MKKYVFIFFVIMGLLSPLLPLKAQKPLKKFGDISKRNLELNVCFLDSSASAYYIFDWGTAYFDYNTMDMVLEYHARIKILNSNGFSYGNVTIPHSATNPITHLKAATYNLVDGKKVTTKVNKSMIFDEKASKNSRRMKISFPDVREGSIIEYSYKKNSGNYIHLVPWVFQTNIPVMYSEFNLRIPDYFQYKYIPAGYEAVDIFTKKRAVERGSIPSTTFHWVMKDIPALKEEPYMPDMDNYYSRIEFELTSIRLPGKATQNFLINWPDYEKDLKEDEDFCLVPDGWNFLKDSVKTLTAGKEGLQIIQSIHDFIGRHVKWNGKDRMYAGNPPRKIYKTGSGNSADINLMYIGLLRQAGFEAYPVILSTRDHGIIRDYSRPVSLKYNYTMGWTKTGDKEYLVDATEPLLPATLIPSNCLNGKGRVISDKPKWVNLQVTRGYNETLLCNFKINDDGTLKGTMNASYKAYPAFYRRKAIESRGEDKYIEDSKKAKSEWTFNKYQIKNAKNPYSPLIENMECSIEGKTEDMGDVLILNPLIHPKWKENPFKSEKRIFPIDFIAPRYKRSIINYTIPEGYAIDEVPGNVRLFTPDKAISYTYLVKTTGNKVQILSSLVIKKALFVQSDYKTIKSFFDEVLGKQSQQIVLKKTHP